MMKDENKKYNELYRNMGSENEKIKSIINKAE